MAATRVLLAGWFSFEKMGATAGDLLARDLVCRWLQQADVPFEVALAPPFTDPSFPAGTDWRAADPGRYSHLVFVCGPFGNGWPITELLPRFAGCRLVGLDLSMLEPLEQWNPFDLLLERDSSRTARPDIVFLGDGVRVPVAGLILVHPQSEYRARSRHREAEEAIGRLVASREMAVVRIDTRLDENRSGLRSPAEVESLIARMDLVITTRLHGLVLALKNGVPALAVDPVGGGAKVRRQAQAIGWPVVLGADELSGPALREALEYCLSGEAREKARRCFETARSLAAGLREQFLAALSGRQPETAKGGS